MIASEAIARGDDAPRSELAERVCTAPGRRDGVGRAKAMEMCLTGRLVEAMGGRVWAYPRPEGGAEFGFALRSFNEEEA